METPKTIRITCRGHAQAPLEAFTPFQGELKKLPEPEFEALRSQIIDGGFSFALHVWEHEGHRYLIDGHQRVTTLKRMQEQGYEIPELPYSLVMAETFQEAKMKLLAAASQYGKTNEIGLANFIKDLEISPVKLVSDFPLPGINMPKFVEMHMPKLEAAKAEEADDGDVGSAPLPGSQLPVSELGDAPAQTSHVRMVQVFLNDETFPEFMEKMGALQEYYEAANLSDALLEVVRESYSAIKPD